MNHDEMKELATGAVVGLWLGLAVMAAATFFFWRLLTRPRKQNWRKP